MLNLCWFNTMKYEIERLQNLMKSNGIDFWYVASGDPHGSEFAHDFFKCCEFLTGFTGENATLIVSPNSAFLWTDGRFFLQADIELEGSGIELMKIGEPDVPTLLEFLTDIAEATIVTDAHNPEFGEYAGYVLGFDGNTVSGQTGMEFEDELEEFGVQVVAELDLAGEVWAECACRPELGGAGVIWELPPEVTGESAEHKLGRVREAMAECDADYLLVSDLMEIAWLFNLRGSDVAYTPVFYSYAIVEQDSAYLYVTEKFGTYVPAGSVNPDIENTLAGMGISVVRCDTYDEMTAMVTDVLECVPAGRTVWYDPATTCYNLCYAAGDGVGLVEETSPIQYMKASKNDTELAASLNAHVKDGAAMVRYIKWIKEQDLAAEELTEYEAAGRIDELRREAGAFNLSFETIAAYGCNAAIVHYAPTETACSVIEPRGFLLVDSGGQYPDGTTDITRTIAVGPLTQEMIDNYTYVLKAHIAMATEVVRPGETGRQLDEKARKPLQNMGLDFNHGLSHGVGHVLGVHEPPNVMSKLEGPRELVPGMIMSDEPGLYLDGKYGIRIENEVYCRLHENGDISFDTITLCPYEREAINTSLLTKEEIQWIDAYHRRVYETLVPLLTEEERVFLKAETESVK